MKKKFPRKMSFQPNANCVIGLNNSSQNLNEVKKEEDNQFNFKPLDRSRTENQPQNVINQKQLSQKYDEPINIIEEFPNTFQSKEIFSKETNQNPNILKEEEKQLIQSSKPANKKANLLRVPNDSNDECNLQHSVSVEGNAKQDHSNNDKYLNFNENNKIILEENTKDQNPSPAPNYRINIPKANTQAILKPNKGSDLSLNYASTSESKNIDFIDLCLKFFEELKQSIKNDPSIFNKISKYLFFWCSSFYQSYNELSDLMSGETSTNLHKYLKENEFLKGSEEKIGLNSQEPLNQLKRSMPQRMMINNVMEFVNNFLEEFKKRIDKDCKFPLYELRFQIIESFISKINNTDILPNLEKVGDLKSEKTKSSAKDEEFEQMLKNPLTHSKEKKDLDDKQKAILSKYFKEDSTEIISGIKKSQIERAKKNQKRFNKSKEMINARKLTCSICSQILDQTNANQFSQIKEKCFHSACVEKTFVKLGGKKAKYEWIMNNEGILYAMFLNKNKGFFENIANLFE